MGQFELQLLEALLDFLRITAALVDFGDAALEVHALSLIHI